MTDKEAFEAWMRTPCPDDYECDPKWAEYILQAAKATGPAWHDAPTVPGLWVVGSRCLHINELDLPIYKDSHCRWYGPIPADDGGKP